MNGYRLEFIVHWLWTITFAILVISGLTLLGPKYGWVTGYSVAPADYLHRTVAPIFTFLTLAGIILEISRLLKKNASRDSWTIFSKTGFGLFNFITANLLLISGVLLWVCTEYSHTITALAAIVHEMATFVMIFAVVWHIYVKSHILVLGVAGNGKK